MRPAPRTLGNLETERQTGLARIDPLTGLANGRQFQEALSAEWNRARRFGYPLAALIDIDAFKAYNDAFGHRAGDDYLRGVALTVAGHARRPGDLAARHGGEEFVILLSCATSTDAAGIAEAIRGARRRSAFPTLTPLLPDQRSRSTSERPWSVPARTTTWNPCSEWRIRPSTAPSSVAEPGRAGTLHAGGGGRTGRPLTRSGEPAVKRGECYHPDGRLG